MNFTYPEGATPIDDISDLKLPWLTTRAEQNTVEAENILHAYPNYFSKKIMPKQWFREDFLKRVHRDMFGQVWQWAGHYYKGPQRNIGIAPYQIPMQMRELCHDVLFWLENSTDLSFVEQSVTIHHRLAQIHPFKNGNGRFARFVADFYLYSLHGRPPTWPEEILFTDNSERRDYIAAMKQADRGEYASLTEIAKKQGGKNPFLGDLVTRPFFSQNFPRKKVVEMARNIIRFDGRGVNELSSNGHHPLQLAIRKKYPEIAACLIDNGADIRQRDKSGLTPLESAIQHEQAPTIIALKKRGVDCKSLPLDSHVKLDYQKLYKQIMNE
jgi:Fic-DOC domain mobile mystery protein B